MTKILQLLPLKTLIKLVFELLQYLVTKTKTNKDDLIVKALYDMYCIILPVIPLKDLAKHIKNKK